MRNILEGLRRGDLEDLVLPMISVDEYESRIDDTAIVIGFYVNEKGAAQDLNRFVQRSPVELLDTEISPAPDSKGYFMVFVELLKNGKFGENVENILEEIASLTKISSWKMRVRGQDDLLPFDAKRLDALVSGKTADPVKEAALSFLSSSDLLGAEFQADTLILEGSHQRRSYTFVDFGLIDTITDTLNLTEAAVALDLDTVSDNRRFELALGSGWSVNRMGDLSLLTRPGHDHVLALRP